MKSKNIASQDSFPKFHQHTTFIVRAKQSQPKAVRPTIPTRLHNKLADDYQHEQKAIELCLQAIEQQIRENVLMQRTISIKIKLQLLALREKYIFQQQGYNQQVKEGKSQQFLSKNNSNKYLSRGKLTTEHLKNKQNGIENTSYCQENDKGKSLRYNSKGVLNTIEGKNAQGKVLELNRKVEKYELEKLSLRVQIAKLESDLNSQAIEGLEKQNTIEAMRHNHSQFLRQLQQKDKRLGKLERQMEQLSTKLSLSQQKVAITESYLQEREKEALTLWQALQAS